jgi:Uma2 family endonuclease
MIATDASIVHYPCSDGLPMAENTVQAEWIVTLHTNINAHFRDRDDVFVAMDNFWYPVEGNNQIVVAPDVYVVLGRPKGDRLSYKQWEEQQIPLTGVIEVLSPGNTAAEMERKRLFYQRYGVTEFIILDPDRFTVEAFVRQGSQLRSVPSMPEYISVVFGGRFVTEPGASVVVYHPDGSRYLTAAELTADRDRLALERKQLASERDRAAAERDRAAAERDRAAAERDQVAAEREQLAAERERLLAMLRALGIKPEAE